MNIYIIGTRLISRFFLLICLMVIISGCLLDGNITQREFSERNPTSYVFNIGITELREKILEAFSIEYQVKSPVNLNFVDIPVRFNIKSFPEKNEFILEENRSWLSNIYLVDGKLAKTRGKFLLKLNPIGNHKSEVLINVISMEIYIGSICCGPHGEVGRSKEVESTSIEEYALLSHIGHFLGIKMPSIKTP